MENAIALSAWELAINPSLYALMRLGFTDEAADYMTWREARCREAAHDRGLQVLYQSTATRACRKRPRTTSTGTRVPGPCGWELPRPVSSNWTSTAG